MSGGVPGLLRHAVRRDRVMIGVVLVVVAVLVYSSVVATVDLYTSVADRVALNTATNANVGAVAMYGPVRDLSGEGLGVGKLRTIVAFLVVFLVVAVVRRHTRADEESGRFELLGGTVVTRRDPLVASLVLASLVSVGAGALTAVGSVGGGWPLGGSLELGAAVACLGLVYAAITAVAVQVFASTSSCSALVYGVLVGSFLLRMVGDVAHSEWLLWLSPFGWIECARAMDDPRWWPLTVPVVVAAGLMTSAFALLARRDVGAGLVTPRPGPDRGAPAGPVGLCWRLLRGFVAGWAVGLLAVGVIMGGLLGSVDQFLTGSAGEFLQRMGGRGDSVDLYLGVVALVFALVVTGFGLIVVLRVRAEEAVGHLEYVLSTRVGRMRALAPYLIVAFAGSTALMLVLVLSVAAAHAGAGGGSRAWGDIAAMGVQLPAVWLVLGLSVVLYGWLPSWTAPVSWSLLAFFALVGEFAPLLHAPAWVSELSPYAYVPSVSTAAGAAPVEWGSLVVMTVLATVLVAVGLIGYRRRGLPVG